MLLSTGNHFSHVDLISPPIVHIAALRCLFTFFVCALLSQTGAQYSEIEYTNDKVLIRNLFTSVPHVEPANFEMMF